MNEQKPRTDILDDSESMLRKVLRLSWPSILAMAFHTSYSLVDMLWVSYIGTTELAALTLAGLVMFALFSISQIFAAGVLALVARAHGAGQREKADVFLRDGLVAGGIAGAITAVLIAANAENLLVKLGAEPEVVEAGTRYVFIMGLSGIVSIPLFTLMSGYRGAGDMITPLVISAGSCALNIVLDPIMIFGVGRIPAMGLAGAAYASVFSIFVAFAWGAARTHRQNSAIRIRLNTPPDMTALKDLLVIGVPAGLHYVLLMLTHTAMIILVATFGTIEIAATGIGARIADFAFIPAIGFGAATSTLVGQYLGAGRTEEAVESVRTSVRITFVVTVVFAMFFVLFPNTIARRFTEDPQVLLLCESYFKLFAATIVFVSTIIILTRVFHGAGDTVWPTVIIAVRFLMFLPVGWYLGTYIQCRAPGVWLALLLSAILQAVMIIWMYNIGTWKRRTLASVQDLSAS